MTAEHRELRDAFRSFFARQAGPARLRAAEQADPPGFDADLWSHARSLGVPEMATEGATLADLAIVAEEHGRALAPIPLLETVVARRLLAQVDPRGLADAVGTSVLTLALRPTADGVAPLVPAGAVADVVLALGDDALILVRDGRQRTAAPNLGSVPLASWDLPDPAVLIRGEPARTAHAAAVDEWRVLMAAALVGLARRALELGVEYAKARHQFGVPIGSFQSIQHRLADVATLVDASGLLAQRAATQPDARLATTAYLLATRAARETTSLSLHIHGGYGFMLEYDIQLYFRRATAWPLLLGDPADELTRLAGLLADEHWTESAGDTASAFRAEVRDVLARVCPDEVIERAYRTGTVHDWDFHHAAAAQGWLTAGWGPAWGDHDRPEHEVTALWEELERVGAPTDGWGTSDLVARTLALVGTAAQRRDIVPRVLRGEILICLGYSEPDSGSDVAAAATRAERDGDDWVINGQKMFTTLAHEASYVFLLTRTNREVPKHRGLTMFLVPMDQPGIEITPIHTLSGERTNITYYSDVRVPDSCRVGEIDGGWSVMTIALAFERNPTMVGELARVLRLFHRWSSTHPEVLERRPVRERLTLAAIDLEAGRALSERMSALAAAGELPIVEGSMAKLFSSEALIRAASGLVDALGVEGSLSPGALDAPADGWVEAMHRHAQVTTIRAGTSEIQRSIIAERGLGLPRSGR
jgi:alkylation response protein AidB-like acyl-CoA dehydrogenase